MEERVGESTWKMIVGSNAAIFHLKSMIHNFVWVFGELLKIIQAGAYPRPNKSAFLNFLKKKLLLIVSDIFWNFKINNVEQIFPNPFWNPHPCDKPDEPKRVRQHWVPKRETKSPFSFHSLSLHPYLGLPVIWDMNLSFGSRRDFAALD